MKRKVFAIAGGLLLGVVALFTLMHLLKAALGLAVIFLVGRGLMRLWHRHNGRPQEAIYPGLGRPSQQPFYGKPTPADFRKASGIVPIW